MNDQLNQIGRVREATSVLGDKWTPHLLRSFLNHDTLRFCQIETLVEGINPRTLSARLLALEEQGIIDKVAPHDSSRCEYRLTEKGRDLAPILEAMSRWSETHALA